VDLAMPAINAYIDAPAVPGAYEDVYMALGLPIMGGYFKRTHSV
jgi:hypothetical protein